MNYEIKSAREASLQEIFYDKNTNLLSYKDSKGIITLIDKIPEILEANSVVYDNSESGLTAENVQSAIDEIATATQETLTKYSPTTATAGTLIIGEEYTITDYVGGVPFDTTIVTGGSGYSIASNVATTGGASTGLTIDILNVSGTGKITEFSINTPSTNYEVNDIITIVGGGGNATFKIITVKGDDFTNVGAVTNVTGEVFIAFESTPFIWDFSSILDSSGIFIPSTSEVFFTVPSEATIYISPDQIFSMGTTPIELLPAPGVINYYDIEKIILEYFPKSIGYSNVSGDFLYINGLNVPKVMSDIITSPTKASYTILYPTGYYVDLGIDEITLSAATPNQNIELTMASANNPTLGDGSLRVIITYTVRKLE